MGTFNRGVDGGGLGNCTGGGALEDNSELGGGAATDGAGFGGPGGGGGGMCSGNLGTGYYIVNAKILPKISVVGFKKPAFGATGQHGGDEGGGQAHADTQEGARQSGGKILLSQPRQSF